MSRKLKFRFWAVKGVIYPHGDTMRYSDSFTSVDLAEGSDWKVMQFTGLKDINGTEIYEGDVVKGQRYLDRPGQFARFIGAVEYDEWWGAYRRKGVKQYQGLDADLRHGRELEVIGNIYQDSHLLTEPNI